MGGRGEGGGGRREANDYVFRELIVKLLSNNYINVLPSGTQCQGQSKKELSRENKNCKKDKWLPFLFTKPQLGVYEWKYI